MRKKSDLRLVFMVGKFPDQRVGDQLAKNDATPCQAVSLWHATGQSPAESHLSRVQRLRPFN
jgi:hypothetical protein